MLIFSNQDKSEFRAFDANLQPEPDSVMQASFLTLKSKGQGVVDPFLKNNRPLKRSGWEKREFSTINILKQIKDKIVMQKDCQRAVNKQIQE